MDALHLEPSLMHDYNQRTDVVVRAYTDERGFKYKGVLGNYSVVI